MCFGQMQNLLFSIISFQHNKYKSIMVSFRYYATLQCVIYEGEDREYNEYRKERGLTTMGLIRKMADLQRNAGKEMSRKEQLKRAAEEIQRADAVLMGAGAGLSAAAGLTYTGERFEQNFREFIEKYGLTDMYSSGFYPFETQEEKWAYWSRHIYYNRYHVSALPVYQKLRELMRGKNYFVLTTNVDHQFWKAGFENERIFATQGDYGLFQCAKACHKTLYDNEKQVLEMLDRQKDCRIPTELVPKCPVCSGEMEVNLRCDGYFVEDQSWYEAAKHYEEFLKANEKKRIVFLELGVGMNTPGIIKYPFWQQTNQLENASYICINNGEAWAPPEIAEKSLCLNMDIAKAVQSDALSGQQHEAAGGEK